MFVKSSSVQSKPCCLYLKGCCDSNLGPLGHDVMHRKHLPFYSGGSRRVRTRKNRLLDANVYLMVFELNIGNRAMVAFEKDFGGSDQTGVDEQGQVWLGVKGLWCVDEIVGKDARWILGIILVTKLDL